MKKFSVFLILSVALHGVMLYFMQPAVSQNNPPPQHRVKAKLKAPKEDKAKGFLPVVAGKIACPSSYVGVGFQYRLISGEIIDIAPGSPAQRMGLRVGDIVIATDDSNIKKLGEIFSITILRNGQKITMSEKTENICTRK